MVCLEWQFSVSSETDVCRLLASSFGNILNAFIQMGKLLLFASHCCCSTIGVFTVDSNGSLRGSLRKQLRLFCCMRFRFEKATQTDFNFDRTEFQTVLKAAELEIHSQIRQLAMLDLTNPDHSQFKSIAYVLAILWDI